ncbi:MAG: GntR family transcriptional regulator [Spirochaetia bacterium]|nr:GntR family transcriptional regulator [Spirochaetia bacterium]
MSTIKTLEKKELKSDDIYRQLKQMIIHNELKQASPLSERKLSEMFSASRTPIREALRRLHNDNFVEITPEYGAFVARVTYDQVSQIYDIREMLEALAVRVFIQSLTPAKLETVNTMHTQIVSNIEAKKLKQALEIDFHFHNYIIQECNNDQLKKILFPIFDQVERILNLTQYTDAWAHESLKEHQLIVKCINDNDGPAAEEVMRKHVRDSKKHQLEQWIRNI